MELAFRTGDIVYTYGEMDEDGFFMGEVNGVRGLVPSNFLSDAGPVGELSAAAGVAAANVRHVSHRKGARKNVVCREARKTKNERNSFRFFF